MDAKKCVSALLRNVIFSKCGRDELISLVESGKIKDVSFEQGEVITGGEKFENALGIPASGKLRVERRDGDKSVLLNVIESGGCFGASTMFGGGGASTVITAASRSSVVFVSEAAMRELISENEDVRMSYIAFLSDRIRFLNSKIQAFTGGSSLDRLRAEIEKGADENGVFRVPGYAELARRLDIGRASLYRSLDALEEDGTIKRDGKDIILLK